jgi:hypothetical protein
LSQYNAVVANIIPCRAHAHPDVSLVSPLLLLTARVDKAADSHMPHLQTLPANDLSIKYIPSYLRTHNPATSQKVSSTHLAASHADPDVSLVSPLAAQAVLDDPVVPVRSVNTLAGLVGALHTVTDSLRK